MKDWCSILVNAGMRNLRVADVAKEQDVLSSMVTRQSKAYGIQLPGQRATCRALAPNERRARVLRHSDWVQEFALATLRRETVTTFCQRVGVCPTNAEGKAREHGHIWPSLADRKVQWWRRQLALAEAGSETLNAFCRRTGKGASTATGWAQYLGHTFQPSPVRSIPPGYKRPAKAKEPA